VAQRPWQCRRRSASPWHEWSCERAHRLEHVGAESRAQAIEGGGARRRWAGDGPRCPRWHATTAVVALLLWLVLAKRRRGMEHVGEGAGIPTKCRRSAGHRPRRPMYGRHMARRRWSKAGAGHIHACGRGPGPPALLVRKAMWVVLLSFFLNLFKTATKSPFKPFQSIFTRGCKNKSCSIFKTLQLCSKDQGQILNRFWISSKALIGSIKAHLFQIWIWKN
jgi:hypothetical protein